MERVRGKMLTRRIPLSQHFRPLLQRLAAAHPETKFLHIPAGMCIPNYPDKNVPTLLIYRNGEISGNVVSGQGLNGMRTTVKGELAVLFQDKTMAHIQKWRCFWRDIEL